MNCCSCTWRSWCWLCCCWPGSPSPETSRDAAVQPERRTQLAPRRQPCDVDLDRQRLRLSGVLLSGSDMKRYKEHKPVKVKGHYFYKSGTGQTLRVHAVKDCRGQYCVIHNPSSHHMLSWPTHWRDDRSLMERLCPHGIGHPDPDHIAFLPAERRSIESTHGCDGCCEVPHD